MERKRTNQEQKKELSESQLEVAKDRIRTSFERRWAFGDSYDFAIKDILKLMKKSSELTRFVREDIGQKEVIEFINLSYFSDAIHEIHLFGIPQDFLAKEPALSAVKKGLLRVLENQHFGEIERLLNEFPFVDEVLLDEDIVSAARVVAKYGASLKQNDFAKLIEDKFRLKV